MSDFHKVEVFAGDEADAGPSIEEQYASLVEEGFIEDAQGGAEGNPEGGNDIPDWVPEKFRGAEDPMKAMAEAYAALERKQSTGEEDDTDAEEADGEEFDEDGEDSETGVTEEDREVAEEATKNAGLDLVAVQAEWDADGELSEETYAALDKAGYPQEAVDVYIEGLLARQNAAQTAAYQIVGGQDAYAEMIQWAAESLSEEEIAVYDEAVNSKNTSKIKSAVKGLNARFLAEVMQEASDEPEDTVEVKGRASGDVYQSFDEYMADLNDPRYDSNETFRNKVMMKLDRSNI